MNERKQGSSMEILHILKFIFDEETKKFYYFDCEQLAFESFKDLKSKLEMIEAPRNTFEIDYMFKGKNGFYFLYYAYDTAESYSYFFPEWWQE